MTPDLIKDVTTPYITNGVLGVSVIALALVVIVLWRTRESDRLTHKKEIAAKDALIDQLHDQILAESRAGSDLARSVERTLEAFLVAIRGKALQ